MISGSITITPSSARAVAGGFELLLAIESVFEGVRLLSLLLLLYDDEDELLTLKVAGVVFFVVLLGVGVFVVVLVVDDWLLF